MIRFLGHYILMIFAIGIILTGIFLLLLYISPTEIDTAYVVPDEVMLINIEELEARVLRLEAIVLRLEIMVLPYDVKRVAVQGAVGPASNTIWIVE